MDLLFIQNYLVSLMNCSPIMMFIVCLRTIECCGYYTRYIIFVVCATDSVPPMRQICRVPRTWRSILPVANTKVWKRLEISFFDLRLVPCRNWVSILSNLLNVCVHVNNITNFVKSSFTKHADWLLLIHRDYRTTWLITTI